MTALGYARISIEDQSTNSLPGQVERITAYCQRNSLQLVKVFIDNGQSAFNFQRREWKEVEQFLKDHKEVKYLVVDTMDRFSRANLVDALQKMDQIQRRTGVKILSVSDPVDLDIEDFGTDLRRVMELMFANYELKRIRKRTSDGIYQAMSTGKWVNNAPYGYKNARDPEGRPTLQIDEEKAYAVRMIFRQFLAGRQLDEIRKHVASAGFKLKGNSAIRRILENPAYAGLINLPKHGHNAPRSVKGLHIALITETDYWMAQNLLGSKKRALQRQDQVFLKGVIRCHCGQVLSSDLAQGKKKKYSYYLCRIHRKNISAIKLHDQFHQILDLLSLPQDVIQETAQALRLKIDEKLGSKGGDLMRANLGLQKIQDRIAATQEKYLAQPDISEKVYAKVMAGLKADEARLQEQVNELSSNSRDYYQMMEDLLARLTNLREIFQEMSLVRKTMFVRTIFGESMWYQDGIIRTPYLHPLFRHNELVLKAKGLLEIQQPSFDLGETPGRRANGSLFEHLTELWEVLVA